jgi:hypothetical protein
MTAVLSSAVESYAGFAKHILDPFIFIIDGTNYC